LKKNGTLAIVIPEEFFVGGGAQSIREYLVKNGYGVKFIVRSAAEIAFSESAHYRDYLIVLKKQFKGPAIIAILKEQIKQMDKDLEELSKKIRDFSGIVSNHLILKNVTCIKIPDAQRFIGRYIHNLKPLVGFNTVECQSLALELLEKLSSAPTLAELEEKGFCRLRLYRPGQYRVKGVEKYAEKLFVSRYRARSPNVTFLLDAIYDNKARLNLRKTKISFEIPVHSYVLSLRTYSGIRHFDISGEEEIAIINLDAIPEHVLCLTGLIPKEKVEGAMQDIKLAYTDFAGKVLLARRIRLTSPNAYWLAFYSSNNTLGSQLPNLQVREDDSAKLLILYLNSSIALLQLLSFAAETEGSWVSLDHLRVWSNIHVPEFGKIKEKTFQNAITLFDKLGKIDVKPLYRRIKEHNSVQRSIDELVLEMLGLNDWKSRLDEIYDAVTKELEAMHKILETSRKQPKKAKVSLEKTESSEKKLDVWIK
jgi:hypothetical protein